MLVGILLVFLRHNSLAWLPRVGECLLCLGVAEAPGSYNTADELEMRGRDFRECKGMGRSSLKLAGKACPVPTPPLDLLTPQKTSPRQTWHCLFYCFGQDKP